jgi:hypothetical protein
MGVSHICRVIHSQIYFFEKLMTNIIAPNYAETGQESRGSFVSELELNLSYLGLSEVICLGPVWNSVAWVNTSVALNVRNGTSPSVMSITPDSLGKIFTIGQRNRSLTCTFKGEPMPKVTWDGPSGVRNVIFGITLLNY